MWNKIKRIYIWDTQSRPVRWLPNTYQAVERIQSSGTQYIDTGYILQTNPKIDISYSFIWGDSNMWIPIYWVRDDVIWTSSYCTMYVQSSSLYLTIWWAWFDPWTSSWVIITKNTRYNMVVDNWQMYIDGVYKSSLSTTNTYNPSQSRTLYVFANHNGDGSLQIRNNQMRLYDFKLYSNGVLQRDFIPCYRKSDSVIWLYDRVNNSFYTNSWTWTFTKWGNI